MSKNRILIVEDEVLIGENLKQILQKNGYEVTDIAITAQEAFSMVKHEKPDLILMDIYLKGDLDGIEAAKQVWTDFDIPVIYLTAHGDEKTFEKAKVTEPYGFILKPFDSRQLCITIDIALYKYNMEKKRLMLYSSALQIAFGGQSYL